MIELLPILLGILAGEVLVLLVLGFLALRDRWRRRRQDRKIWEDLHRERRVFDSIWKV